MQRHNSIQFFFLRSIPYGVIFLLVLVLFLTNYTPGTWLSGWDNLHPEYNCTINIVDRSLFSVWQEYQGLGVRAGNAHAADLLHQIGVCTLKTVLPLSLIRYFYHFLALFIGGVGLYLCAKKLFLKNVSPTVATLAALTGSLWYILNLGTMQYFSVPYEAFSHFFASFPWIILITLTYLHTPSKRNAWLFVLVTILSTPSFYIPTLFIVNTGVFGIISMIYFGQKKRVKPLLFLWIAYIALHAFWLFPFIAFLANGTAFVGQTMINRMFTEEAFLRNQQFGVFPDVVMLKGFLFNTTDLMVKTNTHDFVMKPWITFLQNPAPYGLHIAVFLFVILGVMISWKQKQKHALFLTILLVLGLFAFVNDNSPTGFVFGWFQDHIPLFKQVFRFPFTKFLPVITFAYASILSIALSFLFSTKVVRALAAAFVIAYLGLANIPAFQGHFLYKEMRVVVPQEYFTLFSFLNTQPNGIIATFPQATYWGWTTYDWGYRGSGFPWYGIKQPILDRNFDVWNTSNETYYAALIKALYTTDDPEALHAVLATYNVSYVWIDERVILPNNPDALYIDELKNSLQRIPSVSLLFQNGKQSLYRIETLQDAFVKTKQDDSVTSPFQNTQNVTTTISDDGTVTLAAPIPAGTLTIPGTTSQLQTLGVATWKENTVTVKPHVPTLFTPDDHISSTVSAAQTISVPENTAISTINNTIVSKDTPTSIPLDGTNTLRAYTSPSRTIDITNTLLAQPIKNCASDAKTAALFGVSEHTLIGKASAPCVYGQLASLAKTSLTTNAQSVMNIHITYETTGPTPRICLTKPGETACLYKFQEETTNQNQNTHTAIYTVTPSTTPLGDLWMKIEFDAPETQEERVTVTSLTLSLYQTPSFVKTFSFKQTDPLSVFIEKPTMLYATFPKTNQATTLSINQSHNEQSCYSLGSNTYNKTLLQEGTTISRYEARQNSSVCDWMELPDSITSQGFLFSIQTRNVSGRPIKTCLSFHPPSLCLYETIVPTNKQNTWTTYTQFIAPTTKKGQWFLELDNYAVGQEVRTNDIGPITITPFPYAWLQHISLTSEEVKTETRSPLFFIHHPYPPIYVLTFEAGYTGPLTLFQTFDAGWHAYTKKSQRIPQALFSFFPFLFGNELPNHTRTHSWANGWTIPTTEKDTTIVLFFLPQIFEWIGFLLIPIPFLFIINKKHE